MGYENGYFGSNRMNLVIIGVNQGIHWFKLLYAIACNLVHLVCTRHWFWCEYWY
jgi:hypothetical protein